MPNTAQITLNVTNFAANAASSPAAPFCTINPPTLQDNADNQVGILSSDNMVIWVHSKNQQQGQAGPVNLAFTIAPAGQYVPTGIQFTQARGDGDSDGSNNFGNAGVSGATLTVPNRWRHRGHSHAGAAPRWKFSVSIRRLSDNAVGWIDPGVENSDDM